MVVRAAPQDVGVVGRELDGEEAELAALRAEVERLVQLVVANLVAGNIGCEFLWSRCGPGEEMEKTVFRFAGTGK